MSDAFRNLPALDAHAHLVPEISRWDIEALEAVIFAVTRTPLEYDQVMHRKDSSCIWGLGCHPGLVHEMSSFRRHDFEKRIVGAAFVGEVGIDGRSAAPRSRQETVFREIVAVCLETPRPMSIHSSGATSSVLAVLSEGTPNGTILHWWRGSKVETLAAVDLGCYFSVNGTQPSKLLASIPRNRILTETDYPFTRNRDRRASRPGSVGSAEAKLAECWGMDVRGVRKQIWANLRRLVSDSRCASVLPDDLQQRLLDSAIE